MNNRTTGQAFINLLSSILLVLLVVLLCVFTFCVPCCDVHYDFRMKAIFGSSLRPLFCL